MDSSPFDHYKTYKAGSPLFTELNSYTATHPGPHPFTADKAIAYPQYKYCILACVVDLVLKSLGFVILGRLFSRAGVIDSTSHMASNL